MERWTVKKTSLLAVTILMLLVAPNDARAGRCMGVEYPGVSEEIVVELQDGITPAAFFASYPDLTFLEFFPGLGDAGGLLLVRDAEGTPEPEIAALIDTLDSDNTNVKKARRHRLFESGEGVQRSLPDLDIGLTQDNFILQDAAVTIHTDQAHALYTGKGIVVAIVDTSASLSHPTTAGVMRSTGIDVLGFGSSVDIPADGLDTDGDALVDESAHHATFVAGLVHLAAPDARILHVRALDDDGIGPGVALLRGIVRAQEAGADVINLSFGTIDDALGVEDAIRAAVTAGIPVVVAAGNRGEGSNECVDFPADMTEVITVAAVDPLLTRADFSGFGPEVSLSAPGVDLISTHGDSPFALWDGTSFASPLVSGGIALLLEKYPALSPSDVKRLLEQTAQPDTNGPELDGKMGAGVLDLAALSEVLASDRSSLKVLRGGGGTVASWSPVLGALSYDLVRGRVENLRLSGGLIDLGALTCIGEDLGFTDSSAVPDPELPGEGRAFFYLFTDDAPDGGRFGQSSSLRERTPGAGGCLP